MRSYYKAQIDLVQERAQSMGVTMSDELYKPEGAFYIFLDLSDLIGQPLNKEAYAAVGAKETIQTDEDICYHLLFEEDFMICPASYFKSPAKNGFVRITCSGGDTQLNYIMDRILGQIHKAREAKKEKLQQALKEVRSQLKAVVESTPSASASEHEDLKRDEAHDTIAKIKSMLPAHLLQNVPRRESSGSASENVSPSYPSNASLSSSPVDNVTYSIRSVRNKFAFVEQEKSVKKSRQENREMLALLKNTKVLVHTLDRKAWNEYQEKSTPAAIKIQSLYRGYSWRKVYTELRAEKKHLEELRKKIVDKVARTIDTPSPDFPHQVDRWLCKKIKK